MTRDLMIRRCGELAIAVALLATRAGAQRPLDGVIDMYEDFDQPVPKDGTIGSSAPPIVVKDVIVAGAALQGGGAPPTKANTKGYIRGWDVRTGKRLWTLKEGYLIL